MHYHLTLLPHSQAEIHVSISYSEFEPHIASAARLISEEIEIEGFRKGKAPLEVVKNRVGEMRLLERAADVAVRKTYPGVLKGLLASESALSSRPPLGAPDIAATKLAPKNDFEYRVRLTLLPEVVLPENWRALAHRVAAERIAVLVEPKEVDETLAWIQESRAPLVAVDRPAQAGDSVEIDFEVRHNGVKIENGESRNHPLVLGKGKFLPGFEDRLVGMSAGDKKDFTLVVPEDWRDKAFAGKPLEISATMKIVQERRLPELNDDFAKSAGSFESLDAMRRSIEDGIRVEKAAKEKERIRIRIIEEIARGSAIEVPDVLIEAELDKMFAELQSGVRDMGMTWEGYLAHAKKTAEALRKDWRAEAERRARITLGLGEIAKEEHIEPTEEEIKARADEYLRRFESVEEAEKTIDPERLREYTRGVMRNEKVFEFLESV